MSAVFEFLERINNKLNCHHLLSLSDIFDIQSWGFSLILLAIINVIRLSNTKPFKQKESNNVNVVGPWHLLHFVQKHVVLIAEMAFFTTQNIFENMLYVYGLSLFWPWPVNICAWQWVQVCTDQKLRNVLLNSTMEFDMEDYVFRLILLFLVWFHSIQKIVFLF